MNIKKYLPYLMIAIAFLLGQLSTSKTDRDLVRKYESERKVYLDQMNALRIHISIRNKQGEAIREKMTSDSLRYLEALKVKDVRIWKLKKIINEINLSNATVGELDSLRRIMYGTK